MTEAGYSSPPVIREILKHIAEGLFVFDRNWRYVYANPRGLALTRKSHEELVHASLWEAFPDLVGTEAERCFRDVMEQDTADLFEYYYEPRDLWMEFRLVPTPEDLLTFVTDITERKQAEMAVENLARFPAENPDPVLRVRDDGTLIYANAASASILEEWECAVGALVPESWQEIVDRALSSGQRIFLDVEIQGRILSFGITPVTDPGYVNLYARDVTERKRTDLSELVERVLTLSGKELANGGVEVEVQTGEESALVMAVPDRLHQVFLNLVLNALDAMPEGGRLTLQLEPTETPEGVTVSVADTGVGMPAEVRERIFTPFYTTKKDGVGLGLYVTQNIIADHGGAIRVESEVDAGTIFHVWLPEGGVAEQVQESDTPES